MKISELLDDIAKLNLVLPEFQREYVWDREQAKQLIVSLFNEYPTGSLLFWKTDNPPDIKNSAVNPEKLGTTQVILDGQQRLTTLYMLTRGEHPPYYTESDIKTDPRNLYFNLETGDFQYYQKSRMSTSPQWIAVTDCFEQGRVNPVQLAAEVSETPEEQNEVSSTYWQNLKQLEGILERQYPVQYVPPSANIDDAIDVFDRVNSMGTKLSDAELALAHITGKWAKARRVMKAKMDELAERRFDFDLTFMVRALTGVTKNRALYETIHGASKDELKTGWEKLSKILDYLVSLLPGRAHIHSTDDLNTTNVLVPIVVYLARHDMRFDSDEDLRRCIHWLYAASMWSRYSGQTTNRLDHDLSIIQRRENPWPMLVDAIIDQRGRIEVKPSDFEGRSIRNPMYRMSYVVIKSNGAVDWFNGSPLDEPHGSAYKIHNHHIFPSSLLYSEEGGYSADNHLHKKLVNEIANRAFLTGDSNISLGNTPPAEYLPEVRKSYPGAVAKQFVPIDSALWELDRYEDFLAGRRRLLAEAINERMKKLIADTESPDEDASVEEIAQMDESVALEFKSTMRWDVHREQVNKGLEKVIAKTVAGFMNAEGGTLLIGVADDGEIMGLDADLNTLGRGDLDSFQQKLIQVLENHVGSEFLQHVDMGFESIEGRHVCRVEVDQSPQPVYLKSSQDREFYVRTGNTTRPLNMEEAHRYIEMHRQV